MSTTESWFEVQLERVGEIAEDIELAEQGCLALAMVMALADRAEQIAALRGHGPGSEARDVLRQITEQLGRLE